MPELAAICAVHEIADEVLGCQGTFARMSAVVNDMEANMNAYTQNRQMVFRMLSLLSKELNYRKKRLSNRLVSQSIAGIKRLASNAIRTLRSERISVRNQTPLPSLRVLLSSNRCHSPHQNIVDDGQWNLLGV